MSFGQPEGPDSGEEIDTSDEPSSPDSGEDEDNQGPDSGEDEDNQGPDSGEEIDPNEPTSPDSGEEISLNDYLKSKAKFSCNLINDGSTCIEYIGSFWTKDNAKLNCSSASAFAAKPCPRPALGGCRLNADTSNEIVTWHYSYGGDPYTEVLPYATKSCEALPGGHWIN